jgi:hypothetical protein
MDQILQKPTTSAVKQRTALPLQNIILPEIEAKDCVASPEA